MADAGPAGRHPGVAADRAWPAIEKYGLGFLTSSVWDPVSGEFGGLVMIYGTLATSLIALVIAVPVSFGIALFLTELSPPG
jgi:phosphate transport system permease protein